MHDLTALGEQEGKVPSQLHQLSLEAPEGQGDGTAGLLPSLGSRLLDDVGVEGSKVTLVVSRAGRSGGWCVWGGGGGRGEEQRGRGERERSGGGEGGMEGRRGEWKGEGGRERGGGGEWRHN